MSRLRLADRIAQPFNLLISNVPRSRQPLYFAGAQLCHTFPVSIVADGQGLNITVASS
jgi:diacylglycerol O-acyltransferase / wax synthase